MHRLLRRQLNKAFPDGPPPGLEPFLQLVDDAYQANDEDRGLLDRAMDLTGQELLARNEELAARVRELEQVQERLRASDRWRRQFLNQAAHELGTPLTPIRMQVHALKQGALKKEVRTVALLERNVNRLVALVRDLLDAAKLQSDHLAMRHVEMDLVAAVEAALASHAPAAEEAEVQLHLEAPDAATVVADPNRIGQALDNLIGNAIKFSVPGGNVWARVHAGADVRVEFVDDGRGMHPADLDRIFEPFVQAHEDLSDAPDGTGLGLYISRGIVEACGGELTAYSEGQGKGATFTLQLAAAST